MSTPPQDLNLNLLVEAAVRASWPEEATAELTQTLRAHTGIELPDGRVICDQCSGYFAEPVILLDECPALRALATMYDVQPLSPPPPRS